METKCAKCHEHRAWKTMRTEADWKDSKWLTKDYVNSRVYYRLKGSEGSKGPKDMPDGRGQLTDLEWQLHLPRSRPV